MDLNLFELINGSVFYNKKILGIYNNSQGYLYVSIDGKLCRLHRLIANKYIENLNNLPIVNHIDGNKQNFNINNLEWVSYSDNSKKAYKTIGTMSNMSKKSKHRSIVSICNKTGIRVTHSSLRKCAKYLGRNVAGVYRCLNGEWNNCNNHILLYKN